MLDAGHSLKSQKIKSGFSESPPQHFSDAFNALFEGANARVSGTPQAEGAQGVSPKVHKKVATLTPTTKATSKGAVAVSRWRLKHGISNLLRDVDKDKTPGVCKCGTAGHGTDFVRLVRKNDVGGVRGVFFCDSPWLCPTCAPRRAAERAEKTEEVFSAVEGRGEIVFITLTVQHRDGDSLASLKSLVTEACRKARQGKPWKLATERYGIAGVLVGPEVTWSPKFGWHFHLHLGVPMLGVDPDKAQEGGEWLINRYRSYIENAGGRADRQAQDVTVVWDRRDLSDYLSKGSAAWEVSSAGATKSGKKGLTPWDLAAKAQRGDAKAAALFREYAAVMPGTRSCVITKAMAEKLGIKPDDDSDNPHIEEVDETEVVVGSLEPSRWHKVLRNGYAADVIKAVGEGWEWPKINDLIASCLKEDRWERAFQDGIIRLKTEGPRPDVLHVTEAELIGRARYIQVRRTGRTSIGGALQLAIQSYRDEAVSAKKTLILPDLKSALSSIAA